MPQKTARDLGLVFNSDGYEGELLHTAAIYDQHDFLEELLNGDLHGSVKSTDQSGRTALHTAASHGSINCVKLLLQRGADPNAISGIEDKCFTPVHHAASKSHLDCLTALLEYEVNLDIKNSQGKRAVDVAQEERNSSCVSLINKVKKQREKDQEIAKCEELYDVIDDGCFERAKQILETILDPYSIVNLHYRGPNTFLYRASIGGFVDIAKLLVDYKADGRPNLDSGLTPLYGACYAGHLDVVIYLSQQFPQQLTIPVTVDDMYPLHATIVKGHTEIVKYLLTLRQTVKISIPQDSPRDRIRSLARRNTDASVEDLETGYYVDINQPMKAGYYTPLHLAVLHSNIEIVKALLSCTPVVKRSEDCPPGSLIIDKLANHKTAFHHALFLGKIEIAELLLNSGNDIQQPFDDEDEVAYTPFQYACAYQSEVMVNMLIKNGAKDVEHAGLTEAVQRGRDNIVQILLNTGVCEDEDGKLAVAASEIDLGVKPILINWCHRRLTLFREDWLFEAAFSFNAHIEDRLTNDPGLKLKVFTSINLSNNELESIPIVLFQLPSLRYLYLSNNKLSTLPSASESGVDSITCSENWNCPTLEELELQNNNLTCLPKVLFTMPLLQSINLANNNISSLPFDMWIAPRLKVLSLENNCLSELPFSSDGSKVRPSINIGKKENKQQGGTGFRSTNQGAMDKKKVDISTLNLYSKRPTWDGNSDDSDDEDVHYLNRSGLNKLDLSNNKFTHIPVGLPCLAQNLSKLILKNNNVVEIDSITVLPYSLTTLDMSGNGLKKFDLSSPKPEEICYAIVRKNTTSRPVSYPSSKQKFCSHCRHRQLSELTHLVLSDNQLDNLPLSQRTVKGVVDNQKILFPYLKTLDLSKNRLSRVPMFVGKLSKLCSVSLEGNSSIDMLPSELGLCSELYELKVDHSTIKDPPRNIMEKQTNDGRRDVRFLTGYLRSLHDKAQAYPNIKLMVVGVHGIGKTTLLTALRKDGSGAYQQPDFKTTFNERRVDEKVTRTQSVHSTVGVDICDWQYQKKFQRGTVVKFSTWDFGGQTEYYATHQCFLSRRALYLLLWKLTDGVEGIKQLEQWLLNIQERAPNSSVIIVGTHLDEIVKKNSREFLMEMRNEIKKRYLFSKQGGWKPSEKGLPNIVEIIEVSCKTDTNISKLRELIYDTVTNLKADGRDGHMNLLDKKIPASYIAVEKSVTTLAESMKNEMPVLEEKQFRKQVFEQLKTQGTELRNGDEELDQAVQFLHDYGIMLHYDDPALRDLYFVDPQWLCDMLAHVVTVRSVNPFIKNGVLKISDLQNQIFHGEKRFPSSMVLKYVNLMSKFEVAIKISDKFLLIPSLLPDKQKECPVVCDIESPELRKAMNMHAYLNHDVYRRQYLMSYTPSGFWARLLARLIADDRICKIVSSCCVIQGCGDLDSEQARVDKETLMRAAPPEWACWKTGIELSCFGTKLLRVCQLDCGEPFYGGKGSKSGVFVKSVNSDGVQKMVHVEILSPNVTLNIEKFIQYRPNEDGNGESLVGFRVIGISEVSSQAACQLLVITIEHIDSLFAEWFPKIDGYTNIHGNKAVQRVSFCNLCLRNTLQKTESRYQTSSVQDTDWIENVCNNEVHDIDKEQTVYTLNASILKSESVDSIVILEKEDVEGNMDDDDDDGDIEGDIEGLDGTELELLREYRQNAKGCIIAFELEEGSKLLRKNLPLVCPFHGKVSLENIFPDLCFKDLDKRYIITQTQIKQGAFLADGAFGDIYKAEISREDSTCSVAMKIPKEKEQDVMLTLFSYDTYRSIRQEIAILLPIRHPYIIDFIGISLSPFAMLIELAPCGSLDKCYRKYQKKGKKLNPHVIQKILQQISSGLKYLHRHHIIYRDLKCENVLVWSFPDPSDTDIIHRQVMLKLTDYGISRSVSLSGTKGYHGTPGYMAPEILRYTGKESYTSKVDCFSFGSLIYELISLKQPFRDLANNKANVVQQHMLEGRRPKLSSSEKRFPVLMISLLYRCWAQDPENRPSANEIHNLTSLEEFPKIVDILGLDQSFKFQCVATTNQSQCAYNVADSRSVIGSHLWFCGYSSSGGLTRNQGNIMVSSYHDNKFCHVTNIRLNDRILMVCTVGSTIWLGTESGSIQVFCALQFKPLALTEQHSGRYVLRIIHSRATHSVFIALDDGSVYGYPDNLSSFSEIIDENDAKIYFPFSTISAEVRRLNHTKRFTGDTEMHCLIGVSSHIEKMYTDETITFKDKDGSLLTASSFENESYLKTPRKRSIETSYELWCGQGKGTVLILDMCNLKKMAALPVKGSDSLDPTLRGLKVTFMETSRTFDSMLTDGGSSRDFEQDLETQYIWLVVYPGTEVACWSVDERCVQNTFDASQHSPFHDLNSSKVSSRTKALKATDAQISSLCVIENTMYVGTKFGCLIICDAFSMTVRLIIRCYEECIESIIPLRMISGRNREDGERKLVLTCGRNCFDGWIRHIDRRKHVLKNELTILTWNNI